MFNFYFYIWLSVSITSFIFFILMFIAFKIKQTKNVVSYNVFEYLCIEIIFFNISALMMFFTIMRYNVVLFRVFLVFVILFMYFVFIYLSYITCFEKSDKLKKIYKKFLIVYSIITLIVIIMTLSMPVRIIHSEANGYYPDGTGLKAMFIYGVLSFVTIIIISIVNKVSIKRFGLAIFVYVLALSTLLLQSIFPEIYLTSFSINLAGILIYFSMDFNDTLDLYNNYNISKIENKKVLNNNDNFLNNYSFYLKKSIHSILGIVNTTDYDNKEEVLNNNNILNVECLKLYNLLNDTINFNKNTISSVNNIKYNFYSEINNYFSYLLRSDMYSNIKVDYNVDNSLNTFLYGDINKIKQIISSLLNLYTNNNQNGNINININSTKNIDNIKIRFRISFNQNKIDLDNLVKLYNNNFSSVYSNDNNANIFTMILKLLNGNISVSNEELNVDIDQQLYTQNSNEYLSYVYSNNDFKDKKALILDNAGININILKKYLNKYINNVDVMYNSSQLFEKINSETTYDILFINNKLLDINDYNKLLSYSNLNIVIINNDISTNKKEITNKFKYILDLPYIQNDIEVLLNKMIDSD